VAMELGETGSVELRSAQNPVKTIRSAKLGPARPDPAKPGPAKFGPAKSGPAEAVSAEPDLAPQCTIPAAQHGRKQENSKSQTQETLHKISAMQWRRILSSVRKSAQRVKPGQKVQDILTGNSNRNPTSDARVETPTVRRSFTETTGRSQAFLLLPVETRANRTARPGSGFQCLQIAIPSPPATVPDFPEFR